MPLTKENLLTGHTSPETAFVVADYPYGFRLRCQIRYWLEHRENKGTRFCSQTTNPKVDGVVWNKPKYSTYSAIAGAMFINEEGHVTWEGYDFYHSVEELESFREIAAHFLPADRLAALDRTISVHRIKAIEAARGEFTSDGIRFVSVLVGKKRKDGTLITLEDAREIIRKEKKFLANQHHDAGCPAAA